jgi:hypothetical protein
MLADSGSAINNLQEGVPRKTGGSFKPHLASRVAGFLIVSTSPRSRGSHLAHELLVCVVVGFGKLTGYVVVEAALDELFLEDTSHVAYVISDTDWKPKEAWKYSQDVVS